MVKKGLMTSRYYKFLMYLIIVVLINIAGTTLFFRADLTSNNIYSLSHASKEVVAILSEPLTVKIFFTTNLPAPYNNIERYLHDLMQEYSISGNKYFNYQFFDVSSEGDEKARQNQEIARSYGIYPVQIQNIEQDEVKFQTAHMGIALIHGDIIEIIPTITSTEGLEFKVTSTIRKMNNKISALLNLKEKIVVKLFLSSSLQAVGPYMNLSGLPEIPGEIEEVVERLNERNYGKLTFTYLDPSQREEYEKEAERHNILSLKWDEFRDRSGKIIPADKGYAGIIIGHGEKSSVIQLIKVYHLPLFGTQYLLEDIEDMEGAINETLENLVNINEEIGYLADHGTHVLKAEFPIPGQPQEESLSRFHELLREEYTINQINLKEKGIPEGLPSLIVAGPGEDFTEYELYQIDQFLMNGGNLAFFIDSFDEVLPGQDQNAMMTGQTPLYLPLNTGLGKLLEHYGLNIKKSYVLDKNCFSQAIPRAFGGGERQIYYAPIIKNEFINKDITFLKNIKGLVMLKSSPLEIDEEKIKEHRLNVYELFSSSKKAWELSGRINLNPLLLQPPRGDEDYKQMAMAYILEGSFPSYFADKSIPVKEEDKSATGDDDKKSKDEGKNIDMSHIQSTDITIGSGKPGRIFLIGTSEILKNNVIGDNGNNPNSHFIMNVIDYLNNREEYAVMRSKTQRLNPLREVSPGTRTMIKTANIVGLPVIVVLAGIVVWLRRFSRKRTIQQIFGK